MLRDREARSAGMARSLQRGPTTFVLVAIIAALATSACARSGADDATEPGDLVAAVASYDLVVDRPARFMVGLYTADQSRTLAYGTVSFTFTYPGDRDETDTGSQPAVGSVDAAFLPIPGQEPDPDTAGPELVGGSVATGVYSAPDVEFERAGFWDVTVTGEVDGRTETTRGAFEVLATSDVPAVGEAAPRTRQPLAGDPDVDPKSIDSRASGDTPLPDPELHDLTVADAIAAGRPAMIVVSTPTFCVSRFCGPITDSVQQLALRYRDRMAFIHLEVWQDFAANELNPAAAEWIAPTPQTQGGEPWVFVIDADGIIVQRFDNVASEDDLLAAVENLLGLADS